MYENKIYGKETKTITKILLLLQEINKLVYMGWTLKSITTNNGSENGSEFYDWKKLKRSINNYNNNINVYFYHSYCAWERSRIDHFTFMIKKIYPKSFDFTLVSQENINSKIDKINESIVKV